jgi:hypothetical protein
MPMCPTGRSSARPHYNLWRELSPPTPLVVIIRPTPLLLPLAIHSRVQERYKSSSLLQPF